jgi:hypothetical protein
MNFRKVGSISRVLRILVIAFLSILMAIMPPIKIPIAVRKLGIKFTRWSTNSAI